MTLPSGLQYKIVESGKGAFHPTVDSPCECHYEGRTASNFPAGPKFDSSYDPNPYAFYWPHPPPKVAPVTFAPNQVIKVAPHASNPSTSRTLLQSVALCSRPRAHPTPSCAREDPTFYLVALNPNLTLLPCSA